MRTTPVLPSSSVQDEGPRSLRAAECTDPPASRSNNHATLMRWGAPLSGTVTRVWGGRLDARRGHTVHVLRAVRYK